MDCYVPCPDFVIHICFFSISRTDIQKELECVKNAMHQLYRVEGKPHIYDPVEFEQLCIKAGATTLFHNILMAITSNRQSEKNMSKTRDSLCPLFISFALD